MSEGNWSPIRCLLQIRCRSLRCQQPSVVFTLRVKKSSRSSVMTTLRKSLRGRQVADLDVAERHQVAVVLQADMAARGFAELGHAGELALGHALVPVLAPL